MLSSKAIGCMLPAGIIGFGVMFITQFMQGDQGGTAGTVVWAASSNDWQTIMPMRMLTVILMLIFTVGFTSWSKSISESSSVIAIGSHFTLLAVFLMWAAFVSQHAGFDVASDSTEPTEAAHALVKFSNMGFWFGGVAFAVSFFLVGIKAFTEKAGTPALNGILAVLGIVAAVGSFVNWFLWVGGFGLGLLIMAIIGIQKLRA